MHVYFSGIGGAGIGPLAQIAHELGYSVSGSDKQTSSYIDYLKNIGIKEIYIDQSENSIANVHIKNKIDWLVYTSALTLENPDAPELSYCRTNNIKATKRDEFLNFILDEKDLKLIAIAGTHGKTTTTAMVVWLLKCLNFPISYLLPAKTSFAELGKYEKGSKYFIYEADEFDRNFLAFKPTLSVISGISWDHHEIYKTEQDYLEAFKEFIGQSETSIIWLNDAMKLEIPVMSDDKIKVLDEDDVNLAKINLLGQYNRYDGWLAVRTACQIANYPLEKIFEYINKFPGLSRRMEMIIANLYSDYAHTPEKIRGAMSAGYEIAKKNNQKLVVVYEPLTNRRQKYILKDYKDCFKGADRVYWLPSYLAREDPLDRVILPEELISHLDDPGIAVASQRDDELKKNIIRHLNAGDMVVGMAGGGGNSLDDWLRDEFISS